ncbi:DUF2157 domain-containing protein [Alkalicaulis satelles]|uniref:DUF2157 domain-containing protein n=1 Tax=Alkalicaulis satelles TaxID=2609175 RepID=A0A5M6ZEY1_9PROT|nr:DUF2157 domain-containing protein [Alkalicaulis satelles]KAA5803313.1 DUF2157 domain-containing protein [Alkalicaulis satelles]
MADGYLKRLMRDLDRWIDDGLVPAENREAILARVAPPVRRWNAAGAAAILGAVLLGLAALSFVAANWSELPRLARFALILGALWASYSGAAAAFARANTALGHALALLGAALFGAAIMLTAQTFNISAFRNTGVLIWAAGALITAIALPSRPVLILAAALGGLWAGLEADNPFAPGPVWSYLAVWAVTALFAVRLKSAISLHLLSAGLIIWTGHTLYELLGGYAFDSRHGAAAFILVTGALAVSASLARDRQVEGAGVLAGWMACAAALGALFLQGEGRYGADEDAAAHLRYWIAAGASFAIIAAGLFARWRQETLAPLAAAGLAGAAAFIALFPAMPLPGLAADIVLGAVIYAGAAALVIAGAAPSRRFAGALGVTVFALQSLYVYTRLFGDLLNTAAFFFIGGLLLIALSVVIGRWARRAGQDTAS